jgi:electron transfer flavoprotein alpha subunit
VALILTFAEARDGRLRRASLEVVSEARRLAGPLGATVATVVVGPGGETLAGELTAQGADRVLVFDDPALAAYATESYGRALAQAIADTRPQVVLVPFTAMGKDLAPRVAARLKAPCLADLVEIEISEAGVRARRPVYSGKAYARLRVTGEGPVVATLRPNVFPAGSADTTRSAEAAPFAPALPPARIRVVRLEKPAEQERDVAEAPIVVSGGRGLKGPENFSLVRDLAAALGGAVGASRAVVDDGWIPHAHQVGQTGKVVSPSLYVACGISGAVQHLAGMSTSKVIVAINKDPEAPIFKIADYGIVGDVFEVLPKLTEEIRKLKRD